MKPLLSKLDSIYERHGSQLAMAGAFCLPLKLAGAYFFLIPCIALALIAKRNRLDQFFTQSAGFSVPLIFFFLCTTISSLFGIHPSHSLRCIASFAFYACAIPLYNTVSKKYGPANVVLALVAGQALAGIHSVIDTAFSGALPPLFLGKVSESGQIALTLIAGLGLVFFWGESNEIKHAQDAAAAHASPFSTVSISGLPLRQIALALINLLLMSLWAFSPDYKFNDGTATFIAVTAFLSILGSTAHAGRMLKDKASFNDFLQFVALTILLPVIASTLLVNLKRGPWLGVTVGALVFLLAYARKYVLPVLVFVLSIIIIVSPVRERLAQSSSHFFISGGRNVIWQIGAEMTSRFPLGIGFNNSSVLRKYSTEIPPELRHFHNNALNIAVENGWLGLALFLWWIFSILRTAFFSKIRSPYSVLAASIGCAIISWQVAGSVEYNFGDSEVVIVAFILLGVLTHISNEYSAELTSKNLREKYSPDSPAQELSQKLA